VFKEKCPPGSKISQPVKVMGEAAVQIFIDGDLAETIELKMDSEETETGENSEEELYPGRDAEIYPEAEEVLPGE
ncbi:MAG: hypothetical protein U9R36_02525, partial [Elusimicrobiota bacterium]|nr:hypothetical protein [Elusimicrobiota bacterium]